MDEDIREDWRPCSSRITRRGRSFFVDSLAALADARSGPQPRGEFARLVDLLENQLAGVAGNRIRRANFLDLVADTLELAAARLDASMDAVARLRAAIQAERGKLAAQLAGQTERELLAARRQWESRVLARITSHWGFSPFSLMLRMFQGLGGLAARAVLLRVRSPAQMALWGAWEGTRAWRQHRQRQHADRAAAHAAAACWEAADLHATATILEGFAAEAGLRHEPLPETVDDQAGSRP